MSTENENQNESQNENEIPVAKPVRIVDMADGTQANFGTRANLLSSMNIPTATATFKVITGEVINWVMQGLEGLTDFQKTVYMYGAMEKVKSSLAGVKVEVLAEAVTKNTTDIDNEVFNIRSAGSTGAVTLTTLQKAYALAISKLDGSKEYWNQLEEKAVIAEVLAVWETKTAKERGALRRHPHVALELNVMLLAEGGADSLV